MRSGFAQAATLKIDGPLLLRSATIDQERGEIDAVVEVPPGRHVLRFSCDAAPWENNARRIFRVVDFTIRPERGPSSLSAR